ncbi:phasin family protein [Ottowia thiooxydans]|uniref:phasin family protein n=1 Tax=Ottowia thiooxydans TaxID=219182 RepID=UPI000420C19C|nr:phasin family protein [Ottowia thiooxydans]
MVTRKSSSPPSNEKPESPAETTQETDASEAARHNIWLAGLGAFAKAQAEGTKAFEALVSDGIAMQRKTQALAQERMTEATQRMEALANRAGNVATERWDKLEGIFEQRVARALERLGLPTAADLERLSERLDALERANPTAKAPAAKQPSPGKKQD